MARSFVLFKAQSEKEQLDGAASLSLTIDSATGTENSFQLNRTYSDNVGYIHARYDQYYKGVKVFGAGRIDHIDSVTGKLESTTDGGKYNINISTTPQITPDQASRIAHVDINPKGPYATQPACELVVFMHNGSPQLSFHVHSELLNDVDEPSILEHFIDARTGVVQARWSSLYGAPVVGTGRTNYYGDESLNTFSITNGFKLQDRTRAGSPYNRVLHTADIEANIYTDSDNVWGDHENYNSANGPTSENGKTAAADAAYGVQESYDYFVSRFNYLGQDGEGSPVRAVVHWPNLSNPAVGGFGFIYFKQNVTPAVSVDVVGHEYMHGITSWLTLFNYYPDGPALNEGTSDIFGTMIEFMKPARGDWVMCAQVGAAACAAPCLRGG